MPPQYQGEASALVLEFLSSVSCIRQGLLQAEPRGYMAWLHAVGLSKDWLIHPPEAALQDSIHNCAEVQAGNDTDLESILISLRHGFCIYTVE